MSQSVLIHVYATKMRLCNLLLGLGLVALCTSPALAIEEGAVAPDFTFPDLLTEAPFSLSDFPGQVRVINFWAYW